MYEYIRVLYTLNYKYYETHSALKEEGISSIKKQFNYWNFYNCSKLET